MSRSDVTSEHEIEALIEVAERKRRGNRKVMEDSVDHDAIDTEPDADEDVDKPTRRRARRKPANNRGRTDLPPTPPPGLVTRGIHAGLSSMQLTQNSMVRLGLWGCAAVGMIVLLVVFSFYSINRTPKPLPVTGFMVQWLPGPKVSDNEVLGWIRKFPDSTKLRDGDPAVLAALADHLRKQRVVSAVNEVSVVHAPVVPNSDQLQRSLRIVLALRQPVMPVILATGERAWVDHEGVLLPGNLAAPSVRRPVLRAIEWAGQDGVKAALNLWRLFEPQVEPGLITDIHLYDVLDQRRQQRGIVLYTRHGSRLIWGRPADDRYGVRPEDKVRDLVHSLRAQGDVSRVAAINVRFKEPFYVLRDAQPTSASR